MNDTSRRRRLEPEEPPRGGGGFPIFPLVLVVVFAGLLLGGLLAQFRSRNQPAAVVVVATPSAVPEPTATFAPAATIPPSPAATASPTTEPTRVVSPSPTPVAKPTARLSVEASPTAAPTETSTPSRIVTPAPKPAATKRAATPGPEKTLAPAVQPGVVSSDRAAAIVRSYLGALARGDQSSATSYLSSGLPDETFMSGAKVTSVRTSSLDGGRYKVSADIATPTGEYFETFTLEPGPSGLVIVDHTAIKP